MGMKEGGSQEGRVYKADGSLGETTGSYKETRHLRKGTARGL